MNIFSRHKKPPHLGKYPMEKIKRVDKTTTLIIEDEIKRVPMRANGFFRAITEILVKNRKKPD